MNPRTPVMCPILASGAISQCSATELLVKAPCVQERCAWFVGKEGCAMVALLAGFSRIEVQLQLQRTTGHPKGYGA